MNNRYIFRGKRKDNGEWVEGYYVCLNGDRHFIYTGYAETDCGTYYPDCHEVIPETVGQCTGLKDKNSKWIFEDDVVRTKYYGKIIGNKNVADYDIFKVVYAYAMFRAENKNRTFNLIDGARYEIIGNIHDDKSLLEVERWTRKKH